MFSKKIINEERIKNIFTELFLFREGVDEQILISALLDEGLTSAQIANGILAGCLVIAQSSSELNLEPQLLCLVSQLSVEDQQVVLSSWQKIA